MSSDFEDRGNAPLVMNPLKIETEHISLEVGESAEQIALPSDACLIAILQSSGDGHIRFTLDGSLPTHNRGFILTSTMPPLLLNLCGKSVKLIVIGSKSSGCVLECQFGG